MKQDYPPMEWRWPQGVERGVSCEGGYWPRLLTYPQYLSHIWLSVNFQKYIKLMLSYCHQFKYLHSSIQSEPYLTFIWCTFRCNCRSGEWIPWVSNSIARFWGLLRASGDTGKVFITSFFFNSRSVEGPTCPYVTPYWQHGTYKAHHQLGLLCIC